MKCTEIFKKTLLTVMVLSVCGFSILPFFILDMRPIIISYLGIGIKQLPAKMEKSKESE